MSQLLPVEDPFQQHPRWVVGARPHRSSPRSQKTTGTGSSDPWQGDAAGEVRVWGFPALPWEAPNPHPWLPSPPHPTRLTARCCPSGRDQEQPHSPLLTHLCGCLGTEPRGNAAPKRSQGRGSLQQLRQLLVASCLHSACSQPALAIAANLIACDEWERLRRNRENCHRLTGWSTTSSPGDTPGESCKEMRGFGGDGEIINTVCVRISPLWVLSLALHGVPHPDVQISGGSSAPASCTLSKELYLLHLGSRTGREGRSLAASEDLKSSSPRGAIHSRQRS